MVLVQSASILSPTPIHQNRSLAVCLEFVFWVAFLGQWPT
jgi:hypothetical protein